MVPADHPCLAGHFPGWPVVPAVVVLDHVCRAVETTQPGMTVAAIIDCKFVGKILPGQPVLMTLWPADVQRIDFRCVGDTQKLLVKGRLRLEPHHD